jgi:enoyl-CoA hydratase/carnithine racemase
MSHEIHIRIEQHIAELRIDRPSRKNALTPAMYQSLTDGMRTAEADDAVRVILITGGAELFCSGNDLNDFLNTPPLGADSPVVQFLHTLRDLKKPLVFAVNGIAVGVGVTMLLFADYVVLGDSAKLQLPFINLALCPEGSSSLTLVQKAGYLKAAEKLMFGEPFGADEAVNMGIANCVVPASECLEFAWTRARTLTQKSPHALRETKRLLRMHHQVQLERAIDEEITSFAALLNSPHAKEAMRAFFEKRAPVFA